MSLTRNGNEDVVAAVARSLAEAPWTPELWPLSVGDLAEASGFSCGHLIGAGPNQALTFSIEGRLPDGVFDTWLALGGPGTVVNPRSRAVFLATPMTVIEDSDFINAADRDRHTLYRDVYAPADLDSCFMARVPTWEGGTAIMTAMRSGRLGPPSAEAKSIFARLMTPLADAVRTQTLLELGGGRLALSMLDALKLVTILCDRTGRIVETSAGGDRLLAEATFLGARDRRLIAADRTQDKKLQEVIAAACVRDPFSPAVRTLTLEGDSEPHRMTFDIVRLPAGQFGIASLAVIARHVRVEVALEALPQFGLSRAEAKVAVALSQGFTPREIAARRNVSIETVRTQIKSAYSKLGVRRQSELTRLLIAHGPLN